MTNLKNVNPMSQPMGITQRFRKTKNKKHNSREVAGSSTDALTFDLISQAKSCNQEGEIVKNEMISQKWSHL